MLAAGARLVDTFLGRERTLSRAEQALQAALHTAAKDTLVRYSFTISIFMVSSLGAAPTPVQEHCLTLTYIHTALAWP